MNSRGNVGCLINRSDVGTFHSATTVASLGQRPAEAPLGGTVLPIGHHRLARPHRYFLAKRHTAHDL